MATGKVGVGETVTGLLATGEVGDGCEDTAGEDNGFDDTGGNGRAEVLLQPANRKDDNTRKAKNIIILVFILTITKNLRFSYPLVFYYFQDFGHGEIKIHIKFEASPKLGLFSQNCF